MKIKVLLLLMFLNVFSLFGQLRSFNDLFPNLDTEKRETVFSGILTESGNADASLGLLPSGEIGTKIFNLTITDLRPSCLVESLTVIPYLDKPIGLLAIYNAMGKIRGLKGRLYHSATRDENVPLFEDATRIESPRRTRAIPDPVDSTILPKSDRVYVLLKDVNFGNSYYQADIFTESYGLLYGLSNFRNLSYVIPVIKEGKFRALFYVEPVAEGVLVYSAAAAEVSNFISNRINIPSAIRKRIEVILSWLIDNISE
ncbi:DUF6675 family protein [Treponema primitia]|uniref:DUF6675 family protein n=1 Tax=Treponema primitia TaxID=88058 RepID=UPI00025556AD|nr:DUF6675 family protein [Treponema primitia]